MDFIDFQTFSVVESTTNDDGSLPSPGQRLNLSSNDNYGSNNDSDKGSQQNNFELPDLLNIKGSDGNKSELSSKMANYVKLSINELNISKDSDSSAMSMDNVSASNELKHRPVDVNKLLNNDQNTLEATDQVLSKKLSIILNDHNINNYHQTIKLRKALGLLENTAISNNNEDRNEVIKDNHSVIHNSNHLDVSLDVDNLVSSDYVGILARKTLRNDVETELLKEHITILEDFRPIVRRIKRLSSSIESIKEVNDSLIEKGERTSETNFINDVDALRKEMQLLKLKKQILLTIKDKFTLNQVEEDTIQNGAIDDQFFGVLNKIESIRESATYLLALIDPHAGNALITKLNVNLETINRKVFNHLLTFLYDYGSVSNDELPTYRKCLVYLSNDLSFFDTYIKRVTTERSKLILDEFLSQFDLNIRDKKPIVLNAHDPIRYIGDVLASIHSLIANEADFIKILFCFQVDDSIQYESINKDFLKGLDRKLLNEIVQSLANSCRIRVEQVVRFEESCVVDFEIVQLLKLYKLMFEKKNIDSDNNLVFNLEKLTAVANEKIEEYFAKFIKQNEATKLDYNANTDLLPPDWLSDYLNKLVEFFEIYARNNGGQQYDDEEAVDKQDTITDEFIVKTIEEPFQKILIEQLQTAFPLAKKKEEVKTSFLTALVNCFDLIKTRLQIFSESIFNKSGKIKQIYSDIETKLETSLSTLQDLQIKLLFEKTGLGLYNNLLNMIFPIDQVQDELDYDMYLSLNDNDLMNLNTINTNVHGKLNEFLPQALTELQETLLFKLASPEIADKICEACFSEVCKFYSVFRKVLAHINPSHEEEVYNILNFTEDEFNILLGIDENN